MALRQLLRPLLPSPPLRNPSLPPSPPPSSSSATALTTRRAAAAAAILLLAASPPPRPARAEPGGEDVDEARVVRLFQEASPSVVFIKDLVIAGPQRRGGGEEDEEEGGAKVEGTGSGFVWDSAGHIVTNYHVVAKLAGDGSASHRCKVFLEDSSGNSYSKEGRLVGYDPAYDLAVLKVDVDGDKLRPILIGTSRDLRVGQSCFAIGNPYGYEHTLTTGVVSGLGREIPSPNGRAIRGAIQTDAAINAGNSGGPLIDSYGHVIGVNTATFTRKGSGISSGVNFAIPIDTVVQSVPNLIVYGTSVSNRVCLDEWIRVDGIIPFRIWSEGSSHQISVHSS
ncbi:protease Do-like 5, chloroplastic isoform X1 [Phragmites australis]|uniref:protease Do-like 5, chloroplastic isoform X1 n=1 Tax=Phragmites australis TaxID=29695 RepID=UPI002D7A0E2E|nr:protease Do-like 5, chloroplastic isoform X1 [Phragmites australis]